MHQKLKKQNVWNRILKQKMQKIRYSIFEIFFTSSIFKRLNYFEAKILNFSDNHVDV